MVKIPESLLYKGIGEEILGGRFNPDKGVEGNNPTSMVSPPDNVGGRSM